MLSAYITHPDCARHEMGLHHPECPERLAAIQDHLLVKGLLDYMVPHDAPKATEEQLGRAHNILYIKEILAAAPAEGYFALDPDTNMNPFTVPAALRAAGAAVHATDLVINGSFWIGAVLGAGVASSYISLVPVLGVGVTALAEAQAKAT